MRLANSRVRVNGSEIARNGGVGLKVEDGKGIAWGNAILDNGGYDLDNGGTEEFRAMGNWWGAPDAATVEKRIRQQRIDTGRGKVLYLPCLKGNPLAHL